MIQYCTVSTSYPLMKRICVHFSLLASRGTKILLGQSILDWVKDLLIGLEWSPTWVSDVRVVMVRRGLFRWGCRVYVRWSVWRVGGGVTHCLKLYSKLLPCVWYRFGITIKISYYPIDVYLYLIYIYTKFNVQKR